MAGYLVSTDIHCECGRVTGERCAWTGPADDPLLVTVEWMPVHLRASHIAAGNSGVYPANGAERLRVHFECADLIVDDDDGWAAVV